VARLRAGHFFPALGEMLIAPGLILVSILSRSSRSKLERNEVAAFGVRILKSCAGGLDAEV